MKCFTFHNGKLEEGIETILTHNGSRAVALGAKGTNNIFRIIFFGRGSASPAVDKEGLILEAYPTLIGIPYKDEKGEERAKTRLILKKSFNRNETEILLRVNTSTEEVLKIDGKCVDFGGWPKSWIEGRGFSKGRGWTDSLVTLDDVDALNIHSAGCGRDGRFIVQNILGEISCVPEMEYLKAKKKEAKDKPFKKIEIFSNSLDEKANKIADSSEDSEEMVIYSGTGEAVTIGE